MDDFFLKIQRVAAHPHSTLTMHDKVRALGSVVQNDTLKMIKDGTINGDDIEETIRTLFSSFYQNSTEFQTLYNKTVRYLYQMKRLAEAQEAKPDTTPPLWVNTDMAKPTEVNPNEGRTEDFPTLHLYSPEAHHCDAIIAGDESSLRELKDAIETLLEEGYQTASMEAFTSDGESYYLKVVVIPPYELSDMPLPYTADYAQERQDVGKPPYTYLYPNFRVKNH